MMILLDDQAKAFEKLKTLKVGALFMSPGAGKTLTAFELIHSVEGINYVLWLTPFQTKENLRKELTEYGGFDFAHDVVGIETLSSSDAVYLKLSKKIQEHNTFIVCDESLKIKNLAAKRTQRILELSKFCEYKLILNGTPLSKNVMDLWAQLQFLSPKILNMPLAQYKSVFVKYTTITKKINGYKVTREFIDGYANIDYLYSLIKPYVYECDLTVNVEKHYVEYIYEVGEEAKEEYNRLKKFMSEHEYLLFRNNNVFLELIQNLQMAYCTVPEKFELLGWVLTQVEPKKTIVFCKFIRSVESISKKFPYLKVLTYGKHAYGLNLQEYNTVVFWDKTFDYALRLQAERRIFRTGQTDICTYYDLTASTGLDNMINGNIERKESMLSYFKKIAFKTFIENL